MPASAPQGKRVLVTGANGYIGRAVTEHLRERGFEVTALVRAPKRFEVEGVRVAEGDMRDRDSLVRATKNTDTVVHLAAAKSDEPESYATNVEGARNLVEACKKNSVRSLIVVSTASAKLPKAGVYGATKAAADEIFMQSGVPTTILRVSLVYSDTTSAAFGSLVKFARLPLTPVIGDGTCLFRPIHLDDLATVIARAVSREQMRGRAYDVGGPDEISLNGLVQKIARELLGKKRPHILHVPVLWGLLVARTLSLVLKKPPVTVSNILGSTQNVPWDKEPLFKDASFVPQTLEIGFREIQKQMLADEARVLFRYAYSRSGVRGTLAPDMTARYARSAHAHGIVAPMSALLVSMPFLMGPLDAISKLLYRDGSLQRRLLIAAALVECDTASAPWLLPQERSLLTLCMRTSLLIFSAFLKIISGGLLLLLPRFVKNHVT